MVAMEGRNIQLVAVRDDRVLVMAPRLVMSREEAVNLAAYLVALSGGEDDFIETLSHLEESDLGKMRAAVLPMPTPPDPEAA
jgi:hypothetical protein